jgi:predicted TIM-barrel fold metal-dependent hydrolase
MVKAYHPTPALVTKQTTVEKPRFPAIDIHCHWSIGEDPAALLRAMDAHGLSRAINLSGGFGDALDRMLAKFHAAAPDRLLVFCNLDFQRIDDPTFAADAAAYLESARAGGVSGLKVFKDLGLTVRDRSGRLVPVDDPRLDPAWAACARLKMPVLIHSGDPVAFFQPVDGRNERWMQLKRHPDWSFGRPGFPSYDQVMAQHLRMIARHPDTVFISPHLANSGEDLARLAGWLDAHPNLYVDLSGRVSEIGRQPYAARRFLLKYQDRVLFGTDRHPARTDQPRYRVYYRFLETDDEYFDYYENDFPPEGEWKIYGVSLPDEALRKIYSANAERALAGLMPLQPAAPTTTR